MFYLDWMNLVTLEGVDGMYTSFFIMNILSSPLNSQPSNNAIIFPLETFKVGN